MKQQEEPIINLTDIDEVRKALIMSEILNNKYTQN